MKYLPSLAQLFHGKIRYYKIPEKDDIEKMLKEEIGTKNSISLREWQQIINGEDRYSKKNGYEQFSTFEPNNNNHSTARISYIPPYDIKEVYYASVPGYYIINENEDDVFQLIILYQIEENGIQNLALRAYCDVYSSKVELIFDSVFDKLYKLFLNLYNELKDATIIDKNNGNYFRLEMKDQYTIKFIIEKATYDGSKFINISIGNQNTCKYYNAIYSLYNSLSQFVNKDMSQDEVNMMIKSKVLSR